MVHDAYHQQIVLGDDSRGVKEGFERGIGTHGWDSFEHAGTHVK